MSLEDQQFTKWLRRPTIFVANAWYLMAAAGLNIVSFLVNLLAQLFAALSSGQIPQAAVGNAASAIYEVGVLALPLILYAARHDGVDQSMRLNPPRLDVMLWAALTAFVGVLAVNNISTWWMLLIEALGGRLYASGVPVPTNIDELTASIIMVGVIPGVCEELFFRGGVMGAWERRGTKQALVISSVLFAALHGSILGLPTQLIMGAVLGYVLIISDSLYVSMIYHTVHNTTALVLSYLSAAGGAEIAAESVNLAGQVASMGGWLLLLLQTVLSLLLFAGALMMLTHAQNRHGMNPEKITDGDKTPMTWQELLVLLAGLITVGLTYVTDLLAICGVI